MSPRLREPRIQDEGSLRPRKCGRLERLTPSNIFHTLGVRQGLTQQVVCLTRAAALALGNMVRTLGTTYQTGPGTYQASPHTIKKYQTLPDTS